MSWFDQAACKATPTDVFFPEENCGHFDAALAVCKTCRVVVDCLDFALTNNIRDGVWGFTTPLQRKAIRKKRRIDTSRITTATLAPRFARELPPAVRHATYTGYCKGCRCEPCTDAYRAHRKRVSA